MEKQHIKTCGIDTCGDGTSCNCPCHDERLESYTIKTEFLTSAIQYEPVKRTKRNSCNRHNDCAAADADARKKGSMWGTSHCHDEGCEECFGY